MPAVPPERFSSDRRLSRTASLPFCPFRLSTLRQAQGRLRSRKTGQGTRWQSFRKRLFQAKLRERCILVKVGEEVSAGQGVVVVEAMKMENVFKAPFAGTVKEIFASEGASVESGASLLHIEATPAV